MTTHSTHIGPLALVQRRTRLLPYSTWNVRPTGGKHGQTVAVTLSAPALQGPVIFEVGATGSFSLHH
jgi:cancer susceptibility candidate protein 1